MKKLIVFVGTGFEDIELIATLDIFSRRGIDYDIVSVENKSTVRGKFNAIVETKKMSQIDSKNYDGLFLPGGPGFELLDSSKGVLDIIREYKEKGKLLTAICAAPTVFETADVIGNTKVTAHKNYLLDKNSNESIVVTDKMITARGFKETIDFAIAIADHLS